MPKPYSSKRGRRSHPDSQITPFSGRVFIVDAARGTAVAFMVWYHFCFDLNYFKLAVFDFYHDTFWLTARALIVSAFMLLVGVSLQLAASSGLKKSSYLRRLGVLAVCALTVSVASYVMFPDSGIFFGVLHFILVASMLGMLFVRFYFINLLLGSLCILAGLTIQHPWFDQSWANWIGFVTHKPITQDYAPLFPWFGAVLLGMFTGRWLSSHEMAAGLRNWKGEARPARILAWFGRNSLAVYMTHQPLLLAALYLVSALGYR